MDYGQVNDVLCRVNSDLERRELEDLRDYEIEGFHYGENPTQGELDDIEEGSLYDEGVSAGSVRHLVDRASKTAKGLKGYLQKEDFEGLKTEASVLSIQAKDIVYTVERFEEVDFQGAEGSEVSEQYLSFMAEVSSEVSDEQGVSNEEALDAFEEAAAEMAETGALPIMPDVGVSSQEEIESWLKSAKVNSFVERVGNCAKKKKKSRQ